MTNTSTTKLRWRRQAFLNEHRDDADPDLVEDYEQQLEQLGQTQN